ncbi:MAG TPA: SIMPL domain-containing protein [Candidatus Paceibacterota bacterium]|nr:SIMPL domain-containing protein [Candidatus Paceibacterota bacterium]
MQSFLEKYQSIIIRIVVAVGFLLAIFLLLASISEVKSLRFIGSGLPASNTITVQGNGKLEKAPDTAKFSFTIQNEQKDTASAQANVSKKVDQVKTDLVAAGIPATDITTASYNSYPDYQQGPTIECFRAPCPQPGQTLKGYMVSQSVSVNVKDLSKTETVAGILGKDGVTSIDGPNLGFADDHEVQNEARSMAIADAKQQAEVLAKQLGVHLVRIVSFNDNNGGGIAPIAYGAKAMDASSAAVPPTPSIPTGVQTVNDTVSITYEIR